MQTFVEEHAGVQDGVSGFFGIWDVDAVGCLCRLRESCERPGKHPLVLPSGPGLMGWPHGFKDSVGLDEWLTIRDAVSLVGGRAAARLSGDLWVLDSDSDSGWRRFLALVGSGALLPSGVVAVSRTVRGWHVWYRPPGGGQWSGKAATDEVRKGLGLLGAGVAGLDVKARGGYVVWPDGKARRWIPVHVFARSVEFGLVGGVRKKCSVLGAHGAPAEYAARTPTGALNASGYRSAYQALVGVGGSDGYREEAREAAMNDLLEQVQTGEEPGDRNNALFGVSRRWGVAAVAAGCPLGEVVGVLEVWGRRMGLRPSEVRATVRSGLTVAVA